MRYRTLAVVLMAMVWQTAAIAETWKALPVLDKARSAGSCTDAIDVVTFEVTDKSYSVATPSGKHFTGDIPADGMIKQRIKSTTGNTALFEGNLKTHDMRFSMVDGACHYKLKPL